MDAVNVLAAEGDTNNFLIPNGTFIFEWLVFGIVLWFLWKKVLPPITKRIEQRQETIRQQFEEGERAAQGADREEVGGGGADEGRAGGNGEEIQGTPPRDEA